MSLQTQSPMLLTDLPSDLLLRVMAPIARDVTSALSIAKTNSVLHSALLEALNQTLVIPRVNDINLLSRHTFSSLKSLSLATPYRTDPPLTKLYPLLSLPNLSTIHVRADANSLSHIKQASLLRNLSLQIRESSIHSSLLSTLASLNLHSLSLEYAHDFSQTHLPHGRRCACHPLRADPVKLSMACPSIIEFHLDCPCAASADCTVPPFPNMKKLTLCGSLPSTASESFIAATRHLTDLHLRTFPKILPLIQSLAPKVTGITTQTMQLPLRLHTSEEVAAIIELCPNLRMLHIALHPEAEDSLRFLPHSLEDIMISFGNRKVASARDGVEFHPLPPGFLKHICGLPRLEKLCVQSAQFDMDELKEGLMVCGRRVKYLSFPAHGQSERVDVALSELLDVLRDGCVESLEEINIQQAPNEVIQQLSAIYSDDSACRRLMRSLDWFQRKMPFTALGVIPFAVNMMTGRKLNSSIYLRPAASIRDAGNIL